MLRKYLDLTTCLQTPLKAQKLTSEHVLGLSPKFSMSQFSEGGAQGHLGHLGHLNTFSAIEKQLPGHSQPYLQNHMSSAPLPALWNQLFMPVSALPSRCPRCPNVFSKLIFFIQVPQVPQRFPSRKTSFFLRVERGKTSREFFIKNKMNSSFFIV